MGITHQILDKSIFIIIVVVIVIVIVVILLLIGLKSALMTAAKIAK